MLTSANSINKPLQSPASCILLVTSWERPCLFLCDPRKSRIKANKDQAWDLQESAPDGFDMYNDC